jgi:hypothetical protein
LGIAVPCRSLLIIYANDRECKHQKAIASCGRGYDRFLVFNYRNFR